MPISIKELPGEKLEFQMFVFDELADERISQGYDVIKVTIGITELPISSSILNVLTQSAHDKDITRLVYPQGLPQLRTEIAKYYNTAYKVSTSPDNVFVNAGTSAIFRNLFQLLCPPGCQILLPKPYYCLYLLSAILAGADIQFYEIDIHNRSINLDSFQSKYNPSTTAVVVLNNPGNPLGNVLSSKDVRAINEIVDGNSFIIHDEMYNNVMFYEPYVSPLTYLESHRDKHIIANGFSKGFRMYTKRIGYAIVPDQLIEPMRIIQQHTLLTCDPVSQYGAAVALQDFVGPQELTLLYRSRAEYACNTLTGSGCSPIAPEGGFYIALECRDWIEGRNLGSSIELARDILESVNVATVPGTDFGLPTCLRLSFCNERFNEAIDRLAQYFQMR